MAEEKKATTRLVVNPYQGIDWSTIDRYRANFHAHTTRSDGRMAPEEVIDAYHEAGYTILSITEHDHYADDITWPWTRWDRNPDELSMIGIPGNELFQVHDLGSFWNDFMNAPSGGEETEVVQGLREVESRGGLAVFFHPGRSGRHSVWYASFYRQFDILIGIEVFNQGDRYPEDRLLWDRLLEKLMPARPVWGYSNDDSHGRDHLFGNYQEMLMEDLTRSALEEAMRCGRFTLSCEPGRSGRHLAPRVHSITVEQNRKAITIEGDGFDSLHWITARSEVVGQDRTFHYEDFEQSFVRARLTGKSGETLTQPFGFSRSSLPG